MKAKLTQQILNTAAALCLAALIASAASGTAAAQRRAYKNEGAKPFCITDVGWQGWGHGKDWSGKLCIMGKETMVIDPGPLPSLTLGPVAGAGFYKADPGSYVLINKQFGSLTPVEFEKKECDCSLRVERVAWDHDGGLAEISGLHPTLYLDDDKNIAITSNLKNPKIANGKLYITLEGKGTAEYAVEILFGRIASIELVEPAQPVANPGGASGQGGSAQMPKTPAKLPHLYLALGIAVGLIALGLLAVFVIKKRKTRSPQTENEVSE
jgi:hypothetical protein